jgi:HemY protein
VEELAQRPSPAGLDPASLDAELARFRADLSAAVDEARANVVTAQEEAAAIARQAAEEAAAREAAAAEEAEATRAAAEAAAEAAGRQAALTGILAALDSGEPFEDRLSGLAGAEIPAALSAAAADGVPTLTELVDSFPEAARAALDASIRAGVGGDPLDRVTAFLRVQTGARSLEPRAGDDPDAVLSRAEAALRTGDLPATLAEISTPARGRTGRDGGLDPIGPHAARGAGGRARPLDGLRTHRCSGRSSSSSSSSGSSPRSARRDVPDRHRRRRPHRDREHGVHAGPRAGGDRRRDPPSPRLAGLAPCRLLVAVLRFLNGDETAISRWFDRNRERKGYEALADGLMALASGEARVAMSKAAKAERYLGRPELTNLVTAQAAEMAGDRKKAEEGVQAPPRRRADPLRGRARDHEAEDRRRRHGHGAEAGRKGLRAEARHEETQDVLLRLQAEQHDWKGARKTLSTKLKYGALPRPVHKRRDAVLALGEAKDILNEDNTIEAREAAIEANRLSPDLIPAAAMAARAHVARDQHRYATRILKKAWAASPHPDLATAFAEIEPDETPKQRLKRFEALTKQNPTHPETRLLLAELNVAAEDFAAARGALGDLPETMPNTRVLALLAAIERGEGAPDATVRRLLTRALSAPRGPQWVCDNCHNVAGDWEPVCSNCGAFDTLSWREPPAGAAAPLRGPGGEVLPMIAGEPEPEPVEEPVIADIEPADVTPTVPPDEAGFVADEAKK